ncbi:MAG: hypothetical protein LBJ22_06980, partial [Synergistaceae bacterium]|nr:hypothetical protein [Synergistaceae bacterium]
MKLKLLTLNFYREVLREMKNKLWFLWILLLAATFALTAGGCGGGSGGSGSGGGDTPELGETLPDPDTDTWDGTIDTSWFVDDGQPREYQIKTGAQLAGLAKLVNGGHLFAGSTLIESTFILTNNIDLAGRDWTPIGSLRYYFVGTFDGSGHTISNMRTSMRSDLHVGLFGSNSGTIKDVYLSNIYSNRTGEAYDVEAYGA